jgi:hypothetical protein
MRLANQFIKLLPDALRDLLDDASRIRAMDVV